MNKLLKFMKLNLPKKKITYTTAILFVLFNFLRYITFISQPLMKRQNVYDLSINILGEYLNLTYFFFAIFMLFIYNVENKKSFDQYVFLKFKNRNEWYNYNILQIFAFSAVFVLLIVVQAVLESAATLSFKNVWSSYSIYINSNNFESKDIFTYISSLISPLTYTLLDMIYAFFYFCVIAMIFFILSIVIKKKAWAFIITFAMVCLNSSIYSSGINFLNHLTFFHNIDIIRSGSTTINASLIYNPFIYWGVIIFIVYLCGYIIKSKVDLNYGDNL